MMPPQIEHVGAVMRITLNRPDVRNALNDETIALLTRAFEAVTGQAHTRRGACRSRQRLLCRCRPVVTRDGRLLLGAEPRRRAGAGRHAVDHLQLPGVGGSARPRRLVQDMASQPISPALREDTARRIADIRASDEGKEGLQSFLHKRKPAWIES